MSFQSFKKQLEHIELSSQFGNITKISSSIITATGIKTSIGDVVKITSANGESMGMVLEIERNYFSITPFSGLEGLRIGDKVYLHTHGMSIGLSDEILGRIVNPLIEPLDGKPPIKEMKQCDIMKAPISALKRDIIAQPLYTGVKLIDAALTCGKGQKIGIFAGSGVGKSTLMGMITRGTSATIKVIALIGERGREVREFIEHSLKGDLTNTVIVAVTSDDSPLMRKYGAFAAMSVAEYFKDKGEDVLFIMDSITRFAMAQREIALSLKEPPTSKGYTASTLTLLPKLMERAGGEQGKGSITAFFTVLVDGDDLRDPISDQSRSILDGHIILDRNIADSGLYPPIDLLKSASRVMGSVISKEHKQIVLRFRKLYALLKENEVLLRIGAYQAGSDKALDEAIAKKEQIEEFLAQDESEIAPYDESIKQLQEIIQER